MLIDLSKGFCLNDVFLDLEVFKVIDCDLIGVIILLVLLVVVN